MIKKFKIFETKWRNEYKEKYTPKYKIGDVCIWSYNMYGIPYRYDQQKCEIIQVPENKRDGYIAKFDDNIKWYIDEDNLRLMTENDMLNYTDNLSKIGKMYYFFWDPMSYIPHEYSYEQCKLIDIDENGYVISFPRFSQSELWHCNPNYLKTEKERSDIYIKLEEFRKKHIDIDPYGEENWDS